MFLRYVQIVNFRNLRTCRFEFCKGANTIIGENDSGKSNAMTAIRILLDNDYFYNTKRLKESDFSDTLDDWRGHWIIISAFFDEINAEDMANEICSGLIPVTEDANFLKSYIRCEGNDYGVVTLYIRPNARIRRELSESVNKEDFNSKRAEISLADYEFYFTGRAQANFTEAELYKNIVGDFDSGTYAAPNDDTSIIGTRAEITNIWQHISLVFIDALRDVEGELRKPKNPIKRIFDVLQSRIRQTEIQDIKSKIRELNYAISGIEQIQNIGQNLNQKLQEIVGLVYSPELSVESRLQEDVASIAKNLMITPSDQDSIDMLGLGHLNILYIALKLIEFEYNRNHEILNIMIIEEPEAHIHTHIQKTLFDSLKISKEYTQVIMTTHSTHLSEVSDIRTVNVLKSVNSVTTVMRPTNQLDKFGSSILNIGRDLSLSACLERYLDAKRSVLLFSKGVILVEGDGEEILLPTLIKCALGVSLDEIGLGLINVGSVAFSNIACIFSPERLQRRCSIITDLDATLDGAYQSKQEAARLGKSRKERLEEIYHNNPWVSPFYAPYTFEVDFASIETNRRYIERVINHHFIQQAAKDRHNNALSSNNAVRYDEVIKLADEMGKGWYATVLAQFLDNRVYIPEYLIKGIVFASQDVLSDDIIRKMVVYTLRAGDDNSLSSGMISEFERSSTKLEFDSTVIRFCVEFPDTMVAKLIQFRSEL